MQTGVNSGIDIQTPRPPIFKGQPKDVDRLMVQAARAASQLAGGARPQVRKAPVSAQQLGRLQPCVAAFPQECMGQLASFEPA